MFRTLMARGVRFAQFQAIPALTIIPGTKSLLVSIDKKNERTRNVSPCEACDGVAHASTPIL